MHNSHTQYTAKVIIFAVYCDVLYFSQLRHTLHKQFYIWFCHNKIILYIKPNMCWFHFFLKPISNILQ